MNSSSLHRFSLLCARLALFVIYFWFGLLKVVGFSPASQLVHDLFDLFARTVPVIPFGTFMVCFGIFEMAIGVLFLIKGAERIALVLFAAHMVMTALPLVLLPQETWRALFVPTLESQYIIKNLALIAAALAIGADAQHHRRSVRHAIAEGNGSVV